MSKIEHEKAVVEKMIAIYCNRFHRDRDINSESGTTPLCEECSALLKYAHTRLTFCRHGEKKGSCRKCATHCYAPTKREEIAKVMRYAGPRMILHYPLTTIRHLLN